MDWGSPDPLFKRNNMSVTVTLNPVGNLQQTTTAQGTLNTNNALIETGFSSALNTSGDQMLGTLDMNSNQIINLPAPGTANSPVRLVDIGSTATATPAIIAGSNAYTGNNTFNGVTVFNGSTASNTSGFVTITSTNATITNQLTASTVTASTITATSMTATTITVSSITVNTSLSTPSVTGCFGGFRANLGGTAQSWTTPTTNTYQVMKAGNVVFNTSTCYNASSWTFTPPAGTKIVNLSAHAWVYNNGATGTTPLNTVVGKWIKNSTYNVNGFQNSGGGATDIAAGIAGVAVAANIQTNSSIAPYIQFAAGGSALSNAWDVPSPGDYYNFYVFSEDIFNASGALMSIDGNIAHSYISGFYFV